MNSTGLYVHIPFCKSKCVYCDFLSGIPPIDDEVSRYVSAVIRESELYPVNSEIATVYLGGGTPSLLDEEQLARLIEKLRKNFHWVSHPEFTLEANPDDVTPEKARAWKELNINRVSLGWQSFDRDVLRLLHRRNSPEQNMRAGEILRQNSWDNISVDLILSLRDDNPAKNLENVLAFRPAHVSVYQLTIEEGTVLAQWTREGKYSPLFDEESLDNYWRVVEKLTEAGYIHYEISNFALPGFPSRHNLNYWNYGEYVGLGLGASGFLRDSSGRSVGLRWTNKSDLSGYYESLLRKELPREFTEAIDYPTAIREYIMLGLRKLEGFSHEDFAALFHRDFFTLVDSKRWEELKLWIEEQDGHIRLTRRGLEIANTVIGEVWDRLNWRGLE